MPLDVMSLCETILVKFQEQWEINIITMTFSFSECVDSRSGNIRATYIVEQRAVIQINLINLLQHVFRCNLYYIPIT